MFETACRHPAGGTFGGLWEVARIMDKAVQNPRYGLWDPAAPGIVERIGNTPLLRLRRVIPEMREAELWVRRSGTTRVAR